ncbi:MAG: fibronectin type III domain-containing protein [Acutalibacteraceae bacterium]
MKKETKTNIAKKFAAGLMAAVMMLTPAVPAYAASSSATKTTASTAKAASVSLSKCTVTVAKNVGYTSKALKPAVTVKYGKTTLKQGKHYTVTYSSNTNFGTGKVTVKAISGSGYTGSKTASFNIVPAKPKVTVSTTTSSIKLSWKKVTGATKYYIYSYNTSTKKYTKLKSQTGTSYTVSKLSSGKTYNYAVKAIAVKGSKTYSGITSDLITAATKPAKVTGINLSNSGSSALKVSWKAVSGASGYKVYTYNISKKTYTLRATTKSTSATISGLAANTTYAVTVRAYRTAGGVNYYGAMSSYVKKTTAPAKVGSLKASATDSTVTLSWGKVSGAAGYYVYSYNSTSKKYTKIATVKTNKATISNLTTGKTYYYAVAAYKSSSVIGTKSSVVKATTKKVDYFTKYYNIFRSGTYYVSFSSKTLNNMLGSMVGELGLSEDGSMDITMKVYSKKDDLRMDVIFKDFMNMKIYNLKSEKSAYAYIDWASGVPLGYSKMSKDEVGFDAEMFTQMFAPEKKSGSKVTEGSKKIGSTTYTTYSYKTNDGSTVTYYVNAGSLKQINVTNGSENETINILSVSGSVSDDVFKKPKGIYLPLDSIL